MLKHVGKNEQQSFTVHLHTILLLLWTRRFLCKGVRVCLVQRHGPTERHQGRHKGSNSSFPPWRDRSFVFASALSHFWLGNRKSIRAVRIRATHPQTFSSGTNGGRKPKGIRATDECRTFPLPDIPPNPNHKPNPNPNPTDPNPINPTPNSNRNQAG